MIARRLLAAAILACLVAPAGARESSGGAIYVTTLPNGADAWVDGTYVGRAPVLVDALSVGKHMITAAKTGWVSRELRVTITEREPLAFVNLQLDRDPNALAGSGTLALHAGIPIRSVSVDGTPERLSTSGKLNLPAGDHEIAVETQGGRFTQHVAIYPDTTTNVLVPAGGQNGGRAIVVAPVESYLPASDVLIDGKRIAIRHNGHTVSGVIGDATMHVDGGQTTFDVAPALIGGKLFLPLDLYVRIGAVPLRPH